MGEFRIDHASRRGIKNSEEKRKKVRDCSWEKIFKTK